jgi:molybdate transport system permease protein
MIDPIFSLKLSLLVASIATLVVTIVGTALGYILARTRFPGRDSIDALCMLPLVMPPTVVGFYLLGIFGKRGWLGQYIYGWTGWSPVFTWEGAVIAAAVIALPLMIKTSRAALENIDTTYESVAYTLGKSKLETIFSVTLPLAWRGLLAGMALAFTRAAGEFGATLMLAGNIPGKTQTMPLAIYQATQNGDDNVATGLVILLTVTSFISIWSINKLGAKW